MRSALPFIANPVEMSLTAPVCVRHAHSVCPAVCRALHALPHFILTVTHVVGILVTPVLQMRVGDSEK